MKTPAQRAYITQYLSLIMIILVFMVGAVYRPLPAKPPAEQVSSVPRQWLGEAVVFSSPEALQALSEVLRSHSLGAHIELAAEDLQQGFADGRRVLSEFSSPNIPSQAIEVVINGRAHHSSYRIFRTVE